MWYIAKLWTFTALPNTESETNPNNNLMMRQAGLSNHHCFTFHRFYSMTIIIIFVSVIIIMIIMTTIWGLSEGEYSWQPKLCALTRATLYHHHHHNHYDDDDDDFIEVGCTWCNQLHSSLLRWILVLLNGIWWKLSTLTPAQLPPTLNLNFILKLNPTRNYEDGKENMNCDDNNDKTSYRFQIWSFFFLFTLYTFAPHPYQRSPEIYNQIFSWYHSPKSRQ